MSIDSTFDSPEWAAIDFQAIATRAAGAALAYHRLDPDLCELAILGSDDEQVAALNARYRDIARATNVLSWPAQDLSPGIAGTQPATPVEDEFGDLALGDVALAYETCAREAAAAGKPLADHVTHLIVHGVLHLLGYDHIRDPDATLMERLEVEILGRLGLDDPYRDTDGV